MALPQTIQKINFSMLETIQRDPAHQSSIKLRQGLYRKIEEIGDIESKRVRARLVIDTARYALPYFEPSIQAQISTDEDFREDFEPLLSVPTQLLTLSEEIAFGGVDASQVEPLQKSIYNGVLVQYSAQYAMLAAYKASYEAIRDYDFIKNYFYPQHEIHDADYGRTMLGDTAASAAMAVACKPDRFQFDKDKLLAFWEWWHTQAVPEAWEKAVEVT